jgi:hypothetical protein
VVPPPVVVPPGNSVVNRSRGARVTLETWPPARKEMFPCLRSVLVVADSARLRYGVVPCRWSARYWSSDGLDGIVGSEAPLCADSAIAGRWMSVQTPE